MHHHNWVVVLAICHTKLYSLDRKAFSQHRTRKNISDGFRTRRRHWVEILVISCTQRHSADTVRQFLKQTRSLPIFSLCRVLLSWLGKGNQNCVDIGVGGTPCNLDLHCSQRHALSNGTTLVFRFYVVCKLEAQTWSICKTYPTELCRHPNTSSPDIIFTARRAWHLPRQDRIITITAFR